MRLTRQNENRSYFWDLVGIFYDPQEKFLQTNRLQKLIRINMNMSSSDYNSLESNRHIHISGYYYYYFFFIHFTAN